MVPKVRYPPFPPSYAVLKYHGVYNYMPTVRVNSKARILPAYVRRSLPPHREDDVISILVPCNLLALSKTRDDKAQCYSRRFRATVSS